MSKVEGRDEFGFPIAATDGDLGDQFFELLGRIVVLASANERLVELLQAQIEGVSVNTLVGRAALPTRLTIAKANERLDGFESQKGTSPYFKATVEVAKSFLARVEALSDLRNGYIHSAWLVDEGREFAEGFERRPEFLALRLSAKKAEPGMIQHDPRNLGELRADLARFADVNELGRIALARWRQTPRLK